MSAMTLDELLKDIASPQEKVRSAAWLRASEVGAPAIRPLAAIRADHADPEVARAAARALWNIVRHAGAASSAESEASRPAAVTAALLAALDAQKAPQTKRDLMWMISELAGDEAVPAMVARLSKPELREDARAVLQRIPTDAALTALRSALDSAPPEFRPALADALRHRGVVIADVPSLRLAPVRKTQVKPVGR